MIRLGSFRRPNRARLIGAVVVLALGTCLGACEQAQSDRVSTSEDLSNATVALTDGSKISKDHEKDFPVERIEEVDTPSQSSPDSPPARSNLVESKEHGRAESVANDAIDEVPKAKNESPNKSLKNTRVCRVYYTDTNQSFSVDAGDTLHIPFSTVEQTSLDFAALALTPSAYTLGTKGVLLMKKEQEWVVTLGEEVSLNLGHVPGHATSATLAIGLEQKTMCEIVDGRIEALIPSFDKTLEKYKLRMNEWASSENGFNYYYLGPYLEGLISMSEATGDIGYLTLALSMSMMIINSGKDLNGDGYLDFRVEGKGLDKPDVALYEWRGFRPLARLARLLHGVTWLDEHQLKDADTLSDFVRTNIVEKWSKNFSKAKGIDFFEDDQLIHRASHMGDILVDVVALDDGGPFQDSLKTLGLAVKNQIRRSTRQTGAVEWNILYGNSGGILRRYNTLRGVADTSHASGVVSFVVSDAMLTQEVFNRQDLQRLANTLKTVIWNGDLNKPAFADYVDGGTNKQKPNTYGARNLSDGWVKLGVMDPEVQKLMARTQEVGIQRPNQLQFIGNLARNYRYATWQ